MDFSMSKLSIIACISTIASGQSYRTIGGVQIDDALQRSMLDIHNELRSELALNGLPDSGLYQPSYDVSQPTATYMHALHFDPALAALAQNYLNQQTSCSIVDPSFGHNDNRGSEFINTYGQHASFEYDSSASTIGIGENILQYPIDSSMASYDQAAANAEAGWWDEYKYYLFDYNHCFSTDPPCGHYTQMAWADTRYVGCGSIECGGNLIALCNYYPAGNVGTNKPYTPGTPCSECATKASDRDQCDGSSGGLCSGCQSPWIGRCTDQASNCASQLAAYCPTQTNSGVAKTCGDIGLDGNYDEFLNGHLCESCTETCGTCTASQLAAVSCNNDGLDYQFSGHAAFTFDEDDDPEVIAQSANWAIAAMCMIFGVCCIVLGIGYYLHYKKVDQLEIRLRATKLINNDVSKKEDNIRARAMSETIDNDHRATTDVNVDVEVDEHGETIEIEASIEKTNE